MHDRVTDKASYALSVRDYNELTREVTIKHYRIRKLDLGGVYISPKKSFSDLLQLVDHYHSKCLRTPDRLHPYVRSERNFDSFKSALQAFVF